MAQTLEVGDGYDGRSIWLEDARHLLHRLVRVREMVQRSFAHHPVKRARPEGQTLTDALYQCHASALLGNAILAVAQHGPGGFKAHRPAALLSNLYRINRPAASHVQHPVSPGGIDLVNGGLDHAVEEEYKIGGHLRGNNAVVIPFEVDLGIARHAHGRAISAGTRYLALPSW